MLFGDFNPGGKLPISIPRSAGHLPAFYNHKPSARRGYLFDEVSPLYAFGYGLSYASFAIENVRLGKSRIRRDGRTQVLADVTNTGSFSPRPNTWWRSALSGSVRSLRTSWCGRLFRCLANEDASPNS